MRVGDWAISSLCMLDDRATLSRPRGNLRLCLVCRNEFSSGHWPASGVGRHNFGCRVDGTLNLLHDRLWVVPWLGVPQIAGQLEFTPENWADWTQAHSVVSECPVNYEKYG
jgi:hypothetical protein